MFTGPRREQTSLPISCVRQGRGGRKGGGERRGGRGLVLVGWDAPSARLYQDLSSAAGASVENLYQSPFGPHECYICHHSTYSYMSWFYPLFCFSSAALGLYYTCMFLQCVFLIYLLNVRGVKLILHCGPRTANFDLKLLFLSAYRSLTTHLTPLLF